MRITAIISCGLLAASCGSAPTPAAEEPGPVSQEPADADSAEPGDTSTALESAADPAASPEDTEAETEEEAVEPSPVAKDDFVLEGTIKKKKGSVFYADLGTEGNAIRQLRYCSGRLFVWVEPEEGETEAVWVEVAMVEIVDQTGATITSEIKDPDSGTLSYYTTQHVSFTIQSKVAPATGKAGKIKKGARVKFEKVSCGYPL